MYGGEALFDITLFGLVLLLAGKRPRAQRRESNESRSLSERYLLYGLVGGAAILYVEQTVFAGIYGTGRSHELPDRRADQPLGFGHQLGDHTDSMARAGGGGAAGGGQIDAARHASARRGCARGPTNLCHAPRLPRRRGLGGEHDPDRGILAENRKRLLIAAVALTLFLVTSALFPWLHSTMRYASLASARRNFGHRDDPVLNPRNYRSEHALPAAKIRMTRSWIRGLTGPKVPAIAPHFMPLYDQGDAVYTTNQF